MTSGHRPDPSRRLRSYSAGERAGSSELPAFVGPLCQNTWPTLPLPRLLTSAHHSAQCRAAGSGLQATWGLTLTIGRPHRCPSQGAWHHNAGDWGPRSPVPDSHLGQATTCAHWGTATHSGLENRQSPASPQRPLKAPCTETLGPKLRLPQCPHLGLLLCSPHSHWLRTACLLGANPNPRWALKGPFPRGLAPQQWGLGTRSPSTRLTLLPGPFPGPSRHRR